MENIKLSEAQFSECARLISAIQDNGTAISVNIELNRFAGTSEADTAARLTYEQLSKESRVIVDIAQCAINMRFDNKEIADLKENIAQNLAFYNKEREEHARIKQELCDKIKELENLNQIANDLIGELAENEKWHPNFDDENI